MSHCGRSVIQMRHIESSTLWPAVNFVKSVTNARGTGLPLPLEMSAPTSGRREVSSIARCSPLCYIPQRGPPPHARNAPHRAGRHVHRQSELRHLRSGNPVGGPHAKSSRLCHVLELRGRIRGRGGRRPGAVRQDPRRISFDSEIRPPPVGVDRGRCPQGGAGKAAGAVHRASGRTGPRRATAGDAPARTGQADVAADCPGGHAPARLGSTSPCSRDAVAAAG